MLQDMSMLLQCHSLRSCTLLVSPEDSEQWRALVDGAHAYLRAATSLTELTLRFNDYVDRDVGAMALLTAPAHSGHSSLQSLSLDYQSDHSRCMRIWCDETLSPPPELVPLAGALPGLPHLTILAVNDSPSMALFDAISPDTAPSLRQLRVRLSGEAVCPHGWAHEDGVRGLLQRNPRLHLQVSTLARPCEATCSPSVSPPRRDVCAPCRKGCHQLPPTHGRRRGFVFHAHPEVRCGHPLCHLHVDWLKLNVSDF